MLIDVIRVSLLLTLNIFPTFYSIVFFCWLWIGKFLLGYFSKRNIRCVYMFFFSFKNFRKSITFREWVKYVVKIFSHEIWTDCGNNSQKTTLYSQERGVYQQSKYFYNAKDLLKISICFLFYKQLHFSVQFEDYLSQNVWEAFLRCPTNIFLDYFLEKEFSFWYSESNRRWKQQSNVWNPFKVNNKDTRMTLMANDIVLLSLLWTSHIALYCVLVSSHIALMFPLLTLNK